MNYKNNIKSLSKLQYEVTQNKKTEQPFNNKYNNEFKEGIYVDIVSKKVLFTSLDKYNSGCGWPSFTKPITESAVLEVSDNSHFMTRTEIISSDALSHLGHVFNDGPNGGLRYCINSASLKFIPKKDLQLKGYGQYIRLFNKKDD